MQINKDFLVAKSKNLIYCPTPDCDSVLNKPKCCGGNKAICTICSNATCFKCGCKWH